MKNKLQSTARNQLQITFGPARVQNLPSLRVKLPPAALFNLRPLVSQQPAPSQLTTRPGGSGVSRAAEGEV